MNTRYFTKVEDKYIFNISLIFWHFFIAIGALAVMIGVVVFIYSISPTFKSKVTKEQYPPEAQINASDIQLEKVEVTTAKPTPKQADIIQPAAIEPSISKVGFQQYERAIDTLKSLLPVDKVAWDASYQYIYPQGQSMWDYYQDPKYRILQKVGDGMLGNIEETFTEIKTKSYQERADLLSPIIASVKELAAIEPRKNILIFLLGVTRRSKNYNTAIERLSLLSKSSIRFPINIEGIYPLEVLNEFMQNNPNDGLAFVTLINDNIAKFQRENATRALNVLRYNYSSFTDITQYEAAVKKIIELLPQFPKDKQVEALEKYFEVYYSKNIERSQKIAEIEETFEKQSAEAEMVYLAKKSSKKGVRVKSLVGIAAGIAFISVLAILLVFLSIQRSIRKIEVVIEGNKG